MDDLPTGPIPAATLTKIIEEAGGTGVPAGESERDVNAALTRALADRQLLIQLCLYALDRARSGGVVERIEQGLAGIGVVALRPDGQRFDPAVHEAAGAVETDDPALDGLVAETEVVGFADHERLLRAPVVMVYKKR
ncbi:nucleotide exchange factor GrpE [Amycolatopsis taiwanensis]|uniref:nucleotide exchange factor GrpE n=1 Tax=Amycolatopsis taiwanensis TaxID=342230 RepID=UPI001FE08E23|nr:nucleotide exchange factor GrpE [Amycolatopsis taiwanensis]